MVLHTAARFRRGLVAQALAHGGDGGHHAAHLAVDPGLRTLLGRARSEERRVGKECW